ncbi:hypothetical protein AAFF_G00356930 [Aldrovandia affinis]|uniref:Uncharacterized protein n=1 Tax=Aldrovandia affinis TaxID=143900 RepID=A0AAD7T8Q0_9TELE|nr:hypothetical protein AAFF_G00356930 [Aldrovandia affinis]
MIILRLNFSYCQSPVHCGRLEQRHTTPLKPDGECATSQANHGKLGFKLVSKTTLHQQRGHHSAKKEKVSGLQLRRL